MRLATADGQQESSQALRCTSSRDLPLMRQAIQVRKEILDTAAVLSTARQSSISALPTSIAETKVFENNSVALVDAVYARYIQLGDSIKSQQKIMREAGPQDSASGYFKSSSGATTIDRNNRTSENLIILPEHFSRKDYIQKTRSCLNCCDIDGGRKNQGVNKLNRESKRSSSTCKCKQGDDSKNQNQIISLPVSPWEGSQYKLTLVTSLRAKVYLKFIFTAFVQNVIVKKQRRESVVLCCKKKINLLLKRCFYSILFEALSTRYIAVCADQNVNKLIRKKYLCPAFNKFLRLLTLHVLSSKFTKKALKFRLQSQKKNAIAAFRTNKYLRKLLALKALWATSHAPKMVKSKALIAWILALIRKNTVKSMLTKKFKNFANESQNQSTYEMRTGLINRNINTERFGDLEASKLPGKISDKIWLNNLKESMNNDNQDIEIFQNLKDNALLSLNLFRRESFQLLADMIRKRFKNYFSEYHFGNQYTQNQTIDGSLFEENNIPYLNQGQGLGLGQGQGQGQDNIFSRSRRAKNDVTFTDFSVCGNSLSGTSTFRNNNSRNDNNDGDSMLCGELLNSFRDAVLDNRYNSNRSTYTDGTNRSTYTDGTNRSTYIDVDRDGSFLGVSTDILQNTTAMSQGQGVSRTLLERAMDLSSSSPKGMKGKSQRELNISSQRDYSMMREKDQDERDLYGNYLDEKNEENEFRSEKDKAILYKIYLKSQIQDDVLQSTLLIRRCVRYFNKLKSVRLISLAFRKVRRKHM